MQFDDVDDLPTVNICAGNKRHKYKEGFFIPDARQLAAQRKLEDELENRVAKIFEERDKSNFLATKIGEREIELDKDTLIKNIFKEQLDSEDLLLKSCLEGLDAGAGVLSIPGENPGIVGSKIDYRQYEDELELKRVQFIENLFQRLEKSENNELQRIIDHVLQTFMDMYEEHMLNINLKDVMCHLLLVSAIMLDTRCRLLFTCPNTAEVLWSILDKVPLQLKTAETIEKLSCFLLTHFTHFHDRLHLAQSFSINCNPADLESDPTNFKSRLASYIFNQTLCDLVGYHPQESSLKVCRCFSDLKKVISKGKKTTSLMPYEHYIMIKLSHEIQCMFLITKVEERPREETALKWLLLYFNNVKCNTEANKSVNIHKIKTLCGRIQLLWEMDNAHGGNNE